MTPLLFEQRSCVAELLLLLLRLLLWLRSCQVRVGVDKHHNLTYSQGGEILDGVRVGFCTVMDNTHLQLTSAREMHEERRPHVLITTKGDDGGSLYLTHADTAVIKVRSGAIKLSGCR